MTSQSRSKRDEKLRRQAVRKRGRWKKVGLVLLVLAAFIGVVAVGNWYNARNVTIILAFKDGVGANVAFGMNGPPYGDLVTPVPFSARLTPTDPTSTWSGVVQTDGSYRIELSNASDEYHPATLQVFVEAV